ncbi:hypothetical protein DP939_00460 [Spongiactinospora rosea]|uniref:Signal transduction histidine kinase n=2 Tax=Spongiactinospora rosea TaxID=2248750 RepID=A0A366M688_9ACTN|nr:hypothetical protein DP939_00460 [Spongiactinospora rosea]
MRGGVGLVASVAAVFGLGVPASPGWTAVAVAANTVWVAIFVAVSVTRGLLPWLMAGEVALTCVLCLTQGDLVAAGMLSGGVSWVAGLVTMTIVTTGFAWRPGLAVPVGAAVALCHLAGARMAEAGDGGTVTAGIHVVQILAVAGLMTVLRRAARLADDTLTAATDEQAAAEVLRERRSAQREQNRVWHDTALNVFTAIDQGGLRRGDLRLRNQAAHALVELNLTGRPGEAPAEAKLDARLRVVVELADLTVHTHLVPCAVPWAVAEAFAGAVAEALTNVARYSGVREAGIDMAISDDGEVLVEVVDHGRGFDPGAVPAHRYGLRESIKGRMTSVDGLAEITSRPGRTAVLLSWPASAKARP